MHSSESNIQTASSTLTLSENPDKKPAVGIASTQDTDSP